MEAKSGLKIIVRGAGLPDRCTERVLTGLATESVPVSRKVNTTAASTMDLAAGLGRRWLRVSGWPPRPANAHCRPAREQDQHSTERWRDLFRLRSKRYANISSRSVCRR